MLIEGNKIEGVQSPIRFILHMMVMRSFLITAEYAKEGTYSMAKPSVLIASAINKDVRIVKEFLKSLSGLDTESVEISYCFVDDKESEASSELLTEYIKNTPRSEFLDVPNDHWLLEWEKDDHRWSTGKIEKITFLIRRNKTERAKGIACGVLKLAGTTREGIVKNVRLLLTDANFYERMRTADNPYDGGSLKCQTARHLQVQVYCEWRAVCF